MENERAIYLGLRSIDSLSAMEYIMLEAIQERGQYYDLYWQGSVPLERDTFEQRIKYAYKTFGKHAPLADDRIAIYVQYGAPAVREEISPQKKIAMKVKEIVRPAEIWRYSIQGLLFDFVRIASAYNLIATSEFGERVTIPFLQEIVRDTVIDVIQAESLSFCVAVGRYRQEKDLTRLEIYIDVEIEDTTNSQLYRKIVVYDSDDTKVQILSDILMPTGKAQGLFHDQVNIWLEPDKYQVEIELFDINKKHHGRRHLDVDLIDYQNDAKEISDLVPATLIDGVFIHPKFEKPVGRVIPLIKPVVTIHTPFYLYCEVYNLRTINGEHNVKTIYEIYNKQKMRQEVVDAMIKDDKDFGETAYLAAEYHPMDLEAGSYMLILRVEDMLSGKKRSAVCEFELMDGE